MNQYYKSNKSLDKQFVSNIIKKISFTNHANQRLLFSDDLITELGIQDITPEKLESEIKWMKKNER